MYRIGVKTGEFTSGLSHLRLGANVRVNRKRILA